MSGQSPEVQLTTDFTKVFSDLQTLIQKIRDGEVAVKGLQGALNTLRSSPKNSYSTEKIVPGLDKRAAKQFQAELRQLVTFGLGDLSTQVNTAVTNAMVAGLRNQLKATTDAVNAEIEKMKASFNAITLQAGGINATGRAQASVVRANRERELQNYVAQGRRLNERELNDPRALALREEASQRRLATYSLTGNTKEEASELAFLDAIKARREAIVEITRKQRQEEEASVRAIARINDSIEASKLNLRNTINPVEQAKLQANIAKQELNKGRLTGVEGSELERLGLIYKAAQDNLDNLTSAKKRGEQSSRALERGVNAETVAQIKMKAAVNEVEKAKLALRGADAALTQAVNSGSAQAIKTATDRYTAAKTALEAATKAQKELEAASKPVKTHKSAQEIAARSFEVQNARLDMNGGANQFMAQGRVLTNYAIMGGVIAAFKESIQRVTELEKAMAQLQAISGSTNGEMKKVQDTILKIAENSKYAATELAEGATVMAQAGFSAAQIGTSLEAISRFATATGTSMKEAVDTITSALTVFNLRIEETTRVSDLFTAALNDTKLDPQKLALGLQYVSNVAADSNVTLTELTATMGALSNAGIRSGSTIATGLRQLIIDLSTPSTKLVAELAKVGLTVESVDIKTHGLVGVLRNLREAGFNSANAMASLEVRAANAYSALARQLDTIPGLIEGLNKSGSATDANAKVMDTLSAAITRFGNVWGELSNKFFGPALNIFKNILNLLSDLGIKLVNLEPILNVVGTAFLTFIGAKTLSMVVNLTRGIAGLAAGLVSIGTTAQGAAVGVGVLGTALNTVSKTNLVLAGLSAAIGVAVTAWDMFSSSTTSTDKKLDDVNTSLAETKGRMDANQASIDAVNKEMTRLVERSANFKAEDFPGVIAELRSRFADLGFTIDSNTTKLGDLLERLDQLKRGLAAQMVLDLQINDAFLQVKLQELRNKQLETSSPEALKTTAPNAYKMANAARGGVFDMFSYFQNGPGASRTADPLKMLNSEDATKDINGRVANLSRNVIDFFVQGGGRIDTNKFADTMANALKKVQEYRSELARTGVDSDALPFQALKEIQEKLIIEQSKLRNSLETTGAAIRKGQQDQADTKFAAGPLNDLNNRLLLTQQKIEKGRAFLDTEGINSDQKVAIYNAMRNGGEIKFTDLKGKVVSGVVEGAEADLKSLLAEIDRMPVDDQARPATRELRDRISSSLKQINSKFSDAVKEQWEDTRKSVDQQIKTTTTQMSTLRTKMESKTLSSNPEVLASMEDQYISLIRKRAELQKEKAVKDANEPGKKPSAALQVELDNIEAQAQAEIEKIKVKTRDVGYSMSRVARGYDDFLSRMKDSLKQIESSTKVAIRENHRPVRELETLIASAEAPQNYGRVSQVELDALKERKVQLETAAAGNDVRTYNDALQALQENAVKLAAEYEETKSELDKLRSAGPSVKGDVGAHNDAINRYEKKLSDIESRRNDIENKTEDLAQRRDEAKDKHFIGTNKYQTADSGSNYNSAVKQWMRDQGLLQDSMVGFTDNLKTAFNDTTSAFSDMIYGFSTGAKRGGDAIRDMATSILQSMVRIASNKFSNMLLGYVFDLAGGLFGGAVTGGSGSETIGMNVSSDPILGNQKGGMVHPSQMRRMAGGGRVVGGFPGRDSVPALLDPGEYVLRRSAVQLVGRDFLDGLNNNGNRVVQTSAPPTMPQPKPEKKEPTNFWIVTPDQVPPPSEKDIITIISNDIARGGTTKKLIKQVTMGT